MGIEVRYSDGRRLVVDDRNRKTEYNKEGNVVIRRYKAPDSMKKRSAKGKTYVSKEELTGQGRRTATRIETVQRQAEKVNANRAAVTAAVIKSLEASSERVRVKQQRELLRNIGGLQRTVQGRQILNVYRTGNLNTQIKRFEKRRVYAPEYVSGLKATVNVLRPKPSVVVPKGKYGLVTIEGMTYAPQSQIERNYLSNLKKTISRDQKLKASYARALRSSGLVVSKGDKWFIKAYKGVGAAGVGLLFTGGFLAGAGEKLVASLAGIIAGKRTRQAVFEESGRAGRETPKAVWDGFNPTKPENWVNIILVASIVAVKGYSLQKAKTPIKVKSSKVKVSAGKVAKSVSNKSALSKVNRALKIAKARTKHSKVAKQLRAVQKKLTAKDSVKARAASLKRTAKASAKARVKYKGVSKARAKAYAKKLSAEKKAFWKEYRSRLLKSKFKKAYRASVEPLLKKYNLLVKKLNSILRKKNVKTVDLDKLVKQQLDLKSRINGALKQKRINLQQRGLKTLKKEMSGLSTKAKRTLSTKQRKALKMQVRRGAIRLPRKDVSRAARSLKWVVSKDIRIGKFAKNVVVDLVEKNGKITAVVVSEAKSLAVVKKVGSTLKPVAKIAKPKTTPKGVEVQAGNGQVVLLKPVKTVTKPVVKTVAKVKVVQVQLKTAKQINAYYASLLLKARKGIDLKKAAKNSKEKAFLQLFLTGSVSNLATIVSPKLKVATPSKVKVSSKDKEASVVKSDQAFNVKIISKVGVASKAAVTSANVKVLESLLERLLRRYKKQPKRRKLRFPRRKNKADKNTKKRLDELYSKVKKKYRPSLAAVLFGIYGYRPKVITPLTLRPIIKKRIVKRKNKI